jgi:hypothetical protein
MNAECQEHIIACRFGHACRRFDSSGLGSKYHMPNMYVETVNMHAPF